MHMKKKKRKKAKIKYKIIRYRFKSRKVCFSVLGGRFGFGVLSSEHGTPLIINHEANSPGSSDNKMNFCGWYMDH